MSLYEQTKELLEASSGTMNRLIGKSGIISNDDPRLLQLDYIVKSLKEKGYSSTEIVVNLFKPFIKMNDGWDMDLASLIHSEEFSNEELEALFIQNESLFQE